MTLFLKKSDKFPLKLILRIHLSKKDFSRNNLMPEEKENV